MILFITYRKILLLLCFLPISIFVFAHEIMYCGERIPIESNLVAGKLMNVIKKQIPTVNMLQLRKRVEMYFPTIEYYLQKTGLPDDLKYIAIVESGFQNGTSVAGARGFWQLMPATAAEKGLLVTEGRDERDNFIKSTYAACKVLAQYYSLIQKTFGISSWVLTTAAYNTGIGNMTKKINTQGKDYFTMSLNPETAAYVYKIIAIKELFEYPEYYMKDFGYNVFNNAKQINVGNIAKQMGDSAVFNSMQVEVSQNDGIHPDNITIKEPPKPTNNDLAVSDKKNKNNSKSYLLATIEGRYKNFKDGDLITIKLEQNLEVNGSFTRKGNLIKGNGWIIADRIYIDLGYREHEVTLLDINGKKGISFNELKKNEPVVLKINAD